MSDRDSPDIDRDVAALEQDLGLPDGFYRQLLDENDWSFVLKLHALFESAVTHMLTAKLRHDELQPVLARLDLGDKSSGKLAFAKALQLFSTEERSFLFDLGELRNRLTHTVTLTGFNFHSYVAELDAQQRRQFVKIFGHGVAHGIENSWKAMDRAKFIIENPKLSVWLSGMLCIAGIYLSTELAKIGKQREEFAINALRNHLAAFRASTSQTSTLGGLLDIVTNATDARLPESNS